MEAQLFRLSKAAEYGIRGILHLSMIDEERADIEKIAKGQDVPAAYLGKILQVLTKKGFIRSFRGPAGGFSLSKKPSEITVLEVVEAMEGPIFLNDCLIHSGYCPRDLTCPVHDLWKEAQKKFISHLRATTFESLANSARHKAAIASNSPGAL